MDVVLALAAALLFALAMVLQQQVASTASEQDARRAGFLIELARRPRWLAGVAADALGYVCQAAALAIGRIVVVQPLLATSVVFALPLGARLGGRQVARPEVVAAIAVTAGLAVFLVVADPSGGVDNPSAGGWIASFGASAVVCGVLWVAARGRPPRPRAALLGIAAGVLFALSAALTKTAVEQFDEGVLAPFETWQLYALIPVGYAATALSQASFQTGALAAAVATQTSLNPIASLLLGTLAFEESIHEDAGTVVAALGAFAVMIAGIAFLALHQQPARVSAARPSTQP
jgi:drug/metabolite transporter (DMT)-like permease